MNPVARRALAAMALATSALALPTAPASAEQVPVLVGQHGSHQIWVSPSEPYDVPEDKRNTRVRPDQERFEATVDSCHLR